MPIDRSGAAVLSDWIRGQVGFSTCLLQLRRSEMKIPTRTTISFNKTEFPSHFLGGICDGNLLFSTAHGDEGRSGSSL
jgi:hypothetical protein